MGLFGPFWNTVASLAFLLAGAVAIVAILIVLGRPEGKFTAAAKRVHRVAGWIFTVLFYALFAYMLIRVGNYWEEFPPRITSHITLAITVFLLLAIKVTLPRFFPNLGRHLFFLGILIYALAFPMVLLTAGHYLLSVRILQPYIYHANFNPILADDRLGRELLMSKCSTCHLLEKVLRPRGPQAWAAVMARMVELSPRISRSEASQILYFLTENYVPRQDNVDASSLVEKHCLPCHEPSEILTRNHSAAGWRSIVAKMSTIDPGIVPVALIDELVAELLSATRNNHRAAPTGADRD